jgi:hypothetical protein
VYVNAKCLPDPETVTSFRVKKIKNMCHASHIFCIYTGQEEEKGIDM